MDLQGTRGFSVTVDQLFTSKVFWVPDLDVFLSAGEMPISFTEHQKELARWRDRRILDQVEREPEASYEQYTSCWEDMGSPSYHNPVGRSPGHIVCVTWDIAVRKFGIDRGAGVYSDLGNPDHFHFWFDFGGLPLELAGLWQGQKLTDGLPVITTRIEKGGAAMRSSSLLIHWMVRHPSEAVTCRWCCCNGSGSASCKESPGACRSRMTHHLELAREGGELAVRTEGAR